MTSLESQVSALNGCVGQMEVKINNMLSQNATVAEQYQNCAAA
tara:strand:+ start:210 stop:338 length:129 start_codon:yes stop_codon:yes gene_type:complete